MTEFICPYTEVECEFQGLCERRTQYAKEMVEERAKDTRNRLEDFIENGLFHMRIQRDGEIVPPSKEEEIAHRRAISMSPEAAESYGELQAHLAVERALPIPRDEDEEDADPAAPYDTYSALSGVVCLAGTAEHVRQILDLPKDELEKKIGSLILWINALGSSTDIANL